MWLTDFCVAPWLQQYPMVSSPSGGVVAVCAALQVAHVTVVGGLVTWMPNCSWLRSWLRGIQLVEWF